MKGSLPVMTNNSVPRRDKEVEELVRLYGKYRGMRAVLFTRVSSPGQEHAAQEKVIREKLIKPLGLLLDEERHVIHDTYTGLEYRYREALDIILRMAERREFDVLCLDVLDRGLGRKGVSREVFRGQLRELGIHILTTEPSDHSDDDSLEGQLMRLLKGYKAEEEINDFVRRSKNGQRYKASGDPEKGIPPKIIGSGPRLYGYKYVLNSKGKREMLTLNYDVLLTDSKGVTWTEVRVITFMFRCAKRCIPIRQIASRLNRIGIPAPSVSIGRKYTSKGVKVEKVLWQPAVISRMLRNAAYTGKAAEFKTRTNRIPGKKWRHVEPNAPEDQIIVPIPAIISEEWFSEVGKKLARNRKISRRNNKQPRLTLLRGGLAKCGQCGRNLRPYTVSQFYRNKPKGQQGEIAYRCSAKANGIYQCDGGQIMAHILDAAVWEKALEIIRDPSVVDAEIARRRVGDPTANRRKQINKELKKIREERSNLQANLVRMIANNILDRDTENVLTNRLKELESLENQYVSELADDEYIHREWEKAQKEIEKLHRRCAEMREKLADPNYVPSDQTKRELVEFFGITATLWPQGHTPRFKLEMNPPDIMLHISPPA
jgi:hypothetical protein